MATLDAFRLAGRPRPTIRILQFGGGNFLRAFLDWKIDRMNEAAGTDWGIAVVRSLAGDGRRLDDQDGLYTVLSRGLDADGSVRSEPRIVAAVRRELFAEAEWAAVLDLARDPAVTVVLSNTTEAGIIHDPDAAYGDAPPASLPAKLTRLLHARWTALGGAPDAGWHVFPCELVERNGEILREIVLRHAETWGLEPDFRRWLARANTFYDTLVDRIVPGFPGTEAERLRAELGYDDPFLTAAEAYHFLAIERRAGQPAPRLPLAAHDAGTIVVPDVGAYRARKVAILNGAHTALCPLALLAGVATVGDAATAAAGALFLDRLLGAEVIPYLPLPRDETLAFAAEVRRRFANPFIHHRWHDISLNGLAKYRARNLDRLLAQIDRHGRPGRLTGLSLAAWLAFYLGRFPGAGAVPPRDGADTLDRMRAIGARDDGTLAGRSAMVSAFLAEPAFWGRSLDRPVLRETIVADFGLLTDEPFDMARLGAIAAA